MWLYDQWLGKMPDTSPEYWESGERGEGLDAVFAPSPNAG